MAIANRRRFPRGDRLDLRAPFGVPVQWTGVFSALVAGGAVYVIGVADGGFFPRIWRLSIFAFAALTAAALVARGRIETRRRDLVAVGALAAYTGWIALSKLWSSAPSTSLLEGERGLVYVAVATAVLVGVTKRSLPYVLGGTVAGVTAASAYGLGDYFFSPPPLDRFEGRLLFLPIGYANAFGIYAALGIVLAVGLALGARTAFARAAALAPLVILLPTLYYTSSRGAWVALPAGLAVTLYAGRRIRSPLVLFALLAAGIAAGLALGSGKGQPLSLVGPNRPNYWRVAWQDYEQHPWLGSGAGTYGDFWLHHRPTAEFVHDAHSLYVESLAELGFVGLGLVVLALAVPLLGLRGKQEPAVAAAAGAYVAFVLHAGVDWDWEVPAVTVTGLLCGASVLVGTRSANARGMSIPARGVLVAAVLALAVFAWIRLSRTGGLGFHG